MNDPIKIKKDGPVLEVTIDRPKANAIDSKTSIILGNIFADFRDDPNLCVAILTGAGEKFFSAGWDLKAVSKGEQADEVARVYRGQRRPGLGRRAGSTSPAEQAPGCAGRPRGR